MRSNMMSSLLLVAVVHTKGDSSVTTYQQSTTDGSGIFVDEIPYSNFYQPFQCTGFCGLKAQSGCWCDHHCFAKKDCCYGFKNSCPNYQGSGPRIEYDSFGQGKYYPAGDPAPMTDMTWEEMTPSNGYVEETACKGKCGLQSTKVHGHGFGVCYCDQECHRKNDCCSDKEKYCGPDPNERRFYANQGEYEDSINNQWTWMAGQTPDKFWTSSLLAFNLAASKAPPPPVVKKSNSYSMPWSTSQYQNQYQYQNQNQNQNQYQYQNQNQNQNQNGYSGYSNYDNGYGYDSVPGVVPVFG